MDFPKINEWLAQVEKEMRVTLAQNLAAAVGEIKQFKHGPIDTASYLAWCDKYQAQLVVLAAQISWSEEVTNQLSYANLVLFPLNIPQLKVFASLSG